MKNKLLSFIVCSALVVGTLTGCSMPFGEKVTAESLLEQSINQEREKIDMDLKLVLDAEMDMSELGANGTMSMAMKMDANMQATKEYGHMKGDIEVSLLGMNMNEEMEMYYDYDDEVLYNYDAENDVWTYSDLDDSANISGISDMDIDVFDDLKLEEHKKGNDYVVTATVDYEDMSDVMGSDMDLEDMMSSDEMEDMKMDVKMTFDEKSKELRTMSFTIDMDEVEGVEFNEFSIEITFNEIDDDFKVKIPKSVKSGAVKEDTNGGDIDIWTDQEDDWGDSDILTPATMDPELPTETTQPVVEPSTQPVVSGSDTFGSYNGTSFGIGTPLSTFKNDGWKIEWEDDDAGIFVSYINDKYDGASLYLYGNKDKITDSDLAVSGVYGYSMDISYCEGGIYPSMTWSGLTWGASLDDIKAVYGESTYGYNSTSYDTLTYEATDGTELTFYVSKDNQWGPNGLSRVEVVNYNLMD